MDGVGGGPGRVPLGTDGVGEGLVPLGTDGVGKGAAAMPGAGWPLLVTAGLAPGGVAAFSLGTKTSTAKENERSSPGCSAPTLTTWRATSSPFSFLIAMTTEYSQACPTFGCRTAPSRARAEKLGAGAVAAPGSNFRCFLHAGQLVAL